MRKYLIVGVDPGHTIGVCALDFEGNVLDCASLENAGIEKTVSYLQSLGTPSVIATDVRPAPQFAQRLASYFNVRLFVPRNSFCEDFKRSLLKKEEAKANKKLAKNNHERDAFAAAVMGWRDNQNLIRSTMSQNIDQKEKITHLMLQGYRQEAAQSELNPPTKPQKEIASKPIPTLQKSSVDFDLERKNIALMRRVEILEQQNEQLHAKLNSHERGVVERMAQNKDTQKLKLKISRLEQRLSDEIKRRVAKPACEPKSTQSVFPKKNEKKKPTQSLKGLNSFDKLARLVSEYRSRPQKP